MLPTDDITEKPVSTVESRMDFFRAMELQRDMAKKRDDLNRQNKLLFPTPEL